jgi:hypothetical protein
LHGFSDLLRFETWWRIDDQELRAGPLVPLDVVKLEETGQGCLRIQVKKIDAPLRSLKGQTQQKSECSLPHPSFATYKSDDFHMNNCETVEKQKI